MTGDQFLTLSGKLVAGTQSGPAEYRTALSRAYYGAFHIAIVFLAELGITLPRDHGEVCRCLYESGDPDCTEAGRKLSDLQSVRVRADYRLDDSTVERSLAARLGLENAHEIRSLLDRCRQEPRSVAIKAGIEAYRRRISPRGST